MVSTEDALNEIKRAEKRGDNENVITLCDDALVQLPPDARVYHHRAHANAILDRIPQAIESVTLAISLMPLEPSFRYFRGLWRIEFSEHDEALRDLQTAVELESKLGSTYYVGPARLLSAVALLYLSRFAEAETELLALRPHAKTFVAGKVWTSETIEEHAKARIRPA